MNDNTRDCASCGHMEYHHRPECGYAKWSDTAAGFLWRCECPSFSAPTEATDGEGQT